MTKKKVIGSMNAELWRRYQHYTLSFILKSHKALLNCSKRKCYCSHVPLSPQKIAQVDLSGG